jgi:hypothetical protein
VTGKTSASLITIIAVFFAGTLGYLITLVILITINPWSIASYAPVTALVGAAPLMVFAYRRTNQADDLTDE